MTPDRNLSILLVDDDMVDRIFVVRQLKQCGVATIIESAATVQQAMESLERQAFDCLLVDYTLPDGDADSLLAAMQNEDGLTLPVVVLTGREDEDLGLGLLARGAQDYLVKSQVSTDGLIRAIRHAMERHRIGRELDQAKRRLEAQSQEDHLTGLLNRRGIEKVINREVARLLRGASAPIAMLVDCDDFKLVNERLGHAVGDQVLINVARCLRMATRETDLVARIGGDEFLVLLPEAHLNEGRIVAERIRQELARNVVTTSMGSVPMTVSIGATPVPPKSNRLDQIVAATHLALQRAKSTGKAQAQWVATGLEATLGVANMESLRNCLLDGSGVWAVSQQVMDLRDGRPIATEFLARGPRGFEMPDQILALAREMNILTEVDRQCLRRCIERSYAIGIDGAVHVNVLPSTIAASDPRDLIDICRKTAAGRPVVLEMSHHWIPGDAHELVDRVNTLREGGLSISLDHVGYGRTSLEALLALSPDIIKTDRRLTGGVGRDPRKAQMLRRLADMVSALGATLVALGLENDDDVDVVRNLGIDFGQGLAWGEAA